MTYEDVLTRPLAPLHVERVGLFHHVAHVMAISPAFRTTPLYGASLRAFTGSGAVRKAERWAEARDLYLCGGGERYDPKNLVVNW